ncbi:salicylaldehyde dehydrogenase [Aureobasidium subglaciale]|nr:salicylaldehyde dehydrogenase [Aureobasidium subglaciale]
MGSSNLYPTTIPLIVDGQDYQTSTQCHVPENNTGVIFYGADAETCLAAVASSERNYSPLQMTLIPTNLSKQLTIEHGAEIREVIEEEIHCDSLWSGINLDDAVGMIKETAALMTAAALHGSIVPTKQDNAEAMIYYEPLGVVLGIAPWNSPLTLGMRAVLAPIAAGNTAILKGSEMSPRTHYFVAKLFQEAGFPPGVLNLLLHQPEDAVDVFDCLINAEAVRKCNFTGSTTVGRSIAQKAGAALKPVLLELGGKNCAIILEDADLAKAAHATVFGAVINGGQVCMSTDLVIVVRKVAEAFQLAIRKVFVAQASESSRLITRKSQLRVKALLTDASTKGAKMITSSADTISAVNSVVPTLVENLSPDMSFFHEESFGPLLGFYVVENEEEAIRSANASGYGLSSAIWSKDRYRAMVLARDLRVGAVHINAPTVHDEATLPHGGTGASGFGRFGTTWGLLEFLQTKTVIVH